MFLLSVNRRTLCESSQSLLIFFCSFAYGMVVVEQELTFSLLLYFFLYRKDAHPAAGLPEGDPRLSDDRTSNRGSRRPAASAEDPKALRHLRDTMIDCQHKLVPFFSCCSLPQLSLHKKNNVVFSCFLSGTHSHLHLRKFLKKNFFSEICLYCTLLEKINQHHAHLFFLSKSFKICQKPCWTAITKFCSFSLSLSLSLSLLKPFFPANVF